jgi:hypothetical protein
MEEDIKVLEEFIKYFEAEAISRKYRRNISITVGEDDIEAIENLINRNKQLLGTNLLLAEMLKEDLYIPKSKVREKIEELEKQMEKDEVDDFGIHSIGWSALDYIVDYLRKELLQEGDK